MSNILVGGQAVLEGVMMRAPGIMAIAVRRINGEIQVHSDSLTSLSDKWHWLRKPFLRGILALFQSMILGFKALNFSSAIAMEDIDLQEGKPVDSTAGNSAKGMSNWSVAGVILLTLLIGIGFFFILPLVLTNLLGKVLPLIANSTVFFNFIDGIIRMFFLLAYVAVISAMPQIRRVFEYHGAEHKAIFAYEHNLPLSVENARKFPTLHPRCGTAFLLTVMLVAMIVFSLIPSDLQIWVKGLLRISLLPLIASISFEIIKRAGEKRTIWLEWIIKPGMWLQKITTREPSDQQLEVGLAALRAALQHTRPVSGDIIL
jgi:uncharacterized protein YqhQ